MNGEYCHVDASIVMKYNTKQYLEYAVRSVHVSVRRARSAFYRKELEVVDDFGSNV